MLDDGERRRVTDLCAELVRIPSLPPQEGRLAAAIHARMLELGFDRAWVDDMGNVIGQVGNGSRPVLLLDGHLDTVGVTDAGVWRHDPFAGVVDGGRLYGRGAADMKGSLAAMLCAAASLPAGGDRWCGTVYVSGSVCEELVEGPGLGRVIEQVRPDYVVIGESTSLGLYIGQRGRGEVVVETLGVPAHSSTPHLGENAVRKMAALLGLLDTIALPQDPLLGSALLELTDIISRPYPGISVVPDLCRATFDRRLLVGETPESVLSGLEAVIAGAGGGLRARVALAEARFRTYTGYEVAVPKFAPAWKTPEDHLLVQAARRGLARAGLPVRLGAYGFCTNGSYSAGKYGIPTIGFGPGNESEAHTVDEFVDLESLFAAVEGYRQLALAVCAPDRGDGRAATAPGRGSG